MRLSEYELAELLWGLGYITDRSEISGLNFFIVVGDVKVELSKNDTIQQIVSGIVTAERLASKHETIERIQYNIHKLFEI